MKVKSDELLVRCMVRKEDDMWVAVCIDFTLAAQGATLEEARLRLHEQILAYVTEAVTVDREHAEMLLRRRATWPYRLAFHFARFRARLRHRQSREAYKEALPLQPAAA